MCAVRTHTHAALGARPCKQVAEKVRKVWKVWKVRLSNAIYEKRMTRFFYGVLFVLDRLFIMLAMLSC